jgi:hypothetical protein
MVIDVLIVHSYIFCGETAIQICLFLIGLLIVLITTLLALQGPQQGPVSLGAPHQS